MFINLPISLVAIKKQSEHRQSTNMKLDGSVDFYGDTVDGDDKLTILRNSHCGSSDPDLLLEQTRTFDEHLKHSNLGRLWNCTLCAKGPMNVRDAEVHLNCKLHRFNIDSKGSRSKANTETKKHEDKISSESNSLHRCDDGSSWFCHLCDAGPMTGHDSKVHIKSFRHKAKAESCRFTTSRIGLKDKVQKMRTGDMPFCRRSDQAGVMTKSIVPSSRANNHHQTKKKHEAKMISKLNFLSRCDDGSSWFCHLCYAGPMTEHDSKFHIRSSRHKAKAESCSFARIGLKDKLVAMVTDDMPFYCRSDQEGVMTKEVAICRANSDEAKILSPKFNFLSRCDDGLFFFCHLCDAGPMTAHNSKFHIRSSRHKAKTEAFTSFTTTIINVGASNEPTKVVTLSKPHMIVCPKPNNSQDPNWHDTFAVKIIGNILYVSRLDIWEGWGQDLKLEAVENPKWKNTITIGASTHRTKRVKLPAMNMDVSPYPVNDQDPKWKDKFMCDVDGDWLTVTRLDCEAGWYQPLLLYTRCKV
jgi:hypothetical protein